MEISIVSPVYNAEKIIPELVLRLNKVLKEITSQFEIILVEDCGNDNSWDIIKEICSVDKNIKGIKLSRNFGQHYAITAGLDSTIGKWVIVMDCDLQDRPEEIPALYQKAMEGNEIVLARRLNRTDSTLKKTSSKMFYGALSYLTGTFQDPSVANFGIYNQKVVNALKLLREPIRYFPTMANSDKPIRLIVKTGLLISLISFIIGIIFLVKYFLHQITVPGYTSLMVSIWFIGGLILFVLGLIGLYIGKIFEGVKNRPIYITDTKLNFIS